MVKWATLPFKGIQDRIIFLKLENYSYPSQAARVALGMWQGRREKKLIFSQLPCCQKPDQESSITHRESVLHFLITLGPAVWGRPEVVKTLKNIFVAPTLIIFQNLFTLYFGPYFFKVSNRPMFSKLVQRVQID